MDGKTQMVGILTTDKTAKMPALIELSLLCAGPFSKPCVELTYLFLGELHGVDTHIIPTLQLG